MATAQEPPKPDVRLVIDVSGSMKRNDPNNLRRPAVDLLMRLLPEGGKAGVWTFGKYVNMLVPHGEVDENWRRTAQQKALEINSVALFTNIGEALERAAFDRQAPRSPGSTSLILLTDGMVDIDKDPDANQVEWRRIVDEILPELELSGYTVHTIALSEHADQELLQRLSMATDGLAEVATDADQLMQAFLKAFDVAAPAQQVPLVNNTFVVDSSVEEFTALIFRQVSGDATELIGPDEMTVRMDSLPEDVRWHRTDRYDLITVEHPLEGQWQINAAVEPNTRVTVVSDMRLKVRSLPNNVFLDGQENLNFVLQEEGVTITRPDFLKILGSHVSLAYGDNQEGDSAGQKPVWEHRFDQSAVPADGVFRAALPVFDRLGDYHLRLVVDGKTFKRQFSHHLTVREPFTAELSEQADEDGVLRTYLTVRAHGQNIVLQQTQAVAAVINPARRKLVKPLVLTEFDNWRTPLSFDLPGTYTLAVEITGVDQKGEPFAYSLPRISVDYQPDADFVAEVVEPEPVVEEVSAPPVEQPVAPTEQIETAPPPEPQPSEPADQEAANGLPEWLVYLALALINLALLGGGYWFFRKWMKDPEIEQDSQEAPLAQVEDEAAPDEPPVPEVPMPSEVPMDDGSDDDEIPAMEDLDDADNSVLFDENDDVEEITAGSDQARGAVADFADSDPDDAQAPPKLEDVVDDSDDDFGVDDLEEELLDQIASQAENQSDDNDLAGTIDDDLSDQGLDLPEDEMDEEISNLIDELEGEPEEAQFDQANKKKA